MSFLPGIIDPISDPELQPVPEGWSRSEEQRLRHLDAFRELLSQTCYPPLRTGAGIIYCGGGKYWPGIVLGIRLLRERGSGLPVEIWHRECEPIIERQLEGLGPVTVINADRHAAKHGDARIMRGWEIKLYALTHTQFKRVLYLDADAYLVERPEPILARLEDKPFLFWSDLPGNYATVQWEHCWPGGAVEVPAIQGGQLAIDIPRFWRPLVLSHWLCQHSDYYFSHMFGDQDTYRVALAALGDRSLWGCLGAAPWVRTAFVCGLPGETFPRIVHRCQGKLFRIEDIPPGKQNYNSPQYSLPRESEVFRHLSEILADTEKSPEETFGTIYSRKLWGEGSGPGSLSAESQDFVDLLNVLIQLGKISSLVDLGCGDGVVGEQIRVPHYQGVDCHLPHIERLSKSHPDRKYHHLELIRDREKLPTGELAVVKDVFHHWPTRYVREWLAWAVREKKWKMLLVCHDRGQPDADADCHLGGYRALALKMPPMSEFNFRPVVSYLHKQISIIDLSGTLENVPS